MTLYRGLEHLKVAQRFLTLEINEENDLRDIAKVAAELCHVPIAIITLLNGTQIIENSLQSPGINTKDFFFDQVIQQQMLVVRSEMELKRQGANDADLNNETAIRFYIALPLTTQDLQPLGSICLMDTKPGMLEEIQIRTVEILARQATRTLEFMVSLGILRELYQGAKKSENKIRSFFESSASCYLFIGKDFSILAFNKALEKFVQQMLDINVVEGMDIRTLVQHDHTQKFLDNYQTALNGFSVNSEIELYYKGKPICWSIAYEPARNAEGEIIGVSYNATDISDRVKQEKLVIAQNSSLKEIAFIQSHELRRPLSTILGLIGLIEIENFTVLPRDLSTLRQAAQELDQKIRKIVDFTDSMRIYR